jgi:hypothetical protein
MITHNLLAKGALGAIAGAAALVALSTSASAYIVCNDHGDCWHSTVRYDFARDYPSVKVVYYADDWDWKVHHYHLHQVTGDYGYWDSDKDAWVTVHPVGAGPDPDDSH